MFCQSCGKANDKIGKYCEHCGKESGFPKHLYTKVKPRRFADGGYMGEREARSAGTSLKTVPVTGSVKSHTLERVVGAAAMPVKKWIMIFLGITGLLFTILSVYFTYFVQSPDAVVKKFFNSLDQLNFKEAVSCIDPQQEKAINAATALTSQAVDTLTGINIDFDKLLDLAPVLPDLVEQMTGEEMNDLEKFNVRDVKVVEIKGEKLSMFVNQFGNKIKCIGNALGDEAAVQYTIDEDGQGKTCIVNVRNYGSYGWRLNDDAVIKSVE